MSVVFQAISAMEKCFLDDRAGDKAPLTAMAALRGEEVSFQLAYTADDPGMFPRWVGLVSVETSLPVTVREIASVPVQTPTYAEHDANYLRTAPGLYPDVLSPLSDDGRIFFTYGQLKSLFVTIRVPETQAAGDYPVLVHLTDEGGAPAGEAAVTLHVLDAVLPAQKTIVTDWFHCDGLADFYGAEVFSERHWEVVENFMQTAVDNGINTVLTPVFTPPLDTAVGGERRTVQLVDVTETDTGWVFGFDRLERWVKLAEKTGMQYLEIAHLYTQWGAGHAPKIMGTDKNGTFRRLFGWETDALSDEYRDFLRAFLRAFLGQMRVWGADKRCLFHISDEPGFACLEAYRQAREQIADLLEGYPIIDALSDFAFYQTGAIDHPVPATTAAMPFIEANVPGLWVYYCCGQHWDVSNRFLAMPMARTRILGMQMWRYGIAGFLHWGYNFYNSCHSRRAVNPYLVTDGDAWVPAGDCFSVYPAEDGTALESLRLKAFFMGLQDMRLLDLAAEKAGRAAVLGILCRDGDLTFAVCPDAAWVDETRRLVEALL